MKPEFFLLVCDEKSNRVIDGFFFFTQAFAEQNYRGKKKQLKPGQKIFMARRMEESEMITKPED